DLPLISERLGRLDQVPLGRLDIAEALGRQTINIVLELAGGAFGEIAHDLPTQAVGGATEGDGELACRGHRQKYLQMAIAKMDEIFKAKESALDGGGGVGIGGAEFFEHL